MQATPVVLNTPDKGKIPRPILCQGTFDVEAIRNRVQQVLQSAESRSRRAEQLRLAYPEATTFQQWELPACQLLATGRITSGQYLHFIDDIVSTLVKAARDDLRTPEVQEPKKDAEFDHYPRRTVASWKPVPAAAKYILEVQYRGFEVRYRGDGSTYLVPKDWAAHNDGLHHVEARDVPNRLG